MTLSRDSAIFSNGLGGRWKSLKDWYVIRGIYGVTNSFNSTSKNKIMCTFVTRDSGIAPLFLSVIWTHFALVYGFMQM